jgi:hypothetical protein
MLSILTHPTRSSAEDVTTEPRQVNINCFYFRMSPPKGVKLIYGPNARGVAGEASPANAGAAVTHNPGPTIAATSTEPSDDPFVQKNACVMRCHHR